MANYEIIAFYKDSEEEIKVLANKIGILYNLNVRFEKLPATAASIVTLLSEKTVLCILNRDTLKFGKLLKYAYEINKPMLLVRASYPEDSYNHFNIPVGYLQENKEKVVWANFFQRYNTKATIELTIPQEKDEGIAHLVDNNVSFIENIFNNSNARYTKSFFKGSFEHILKNTFIQTDNSIVFIMRPFRLFPFYTPLNLRLFKRYSHTPTLLIPRDDALYIPCH